MGPRPGRFPPVAAGPPEPENDVNEVPKITIVEPEQGGFLTAADDLGAALQDGEKMTKLLARVAEQARALVPDVSTAKGRDAIRSNAYRVTRSRTAVHQAGLDLTEMWRKQTAAVNKAREAAKAELEELEAEVRAPLTEWEIAEEARKAKLAELLESLRPQVDRDSRTDEITAERARIAAIEITDEVWQEVADAGRERQREALELLARDLKFAQEREDQQAEIRRMATELAAQKAAAEAAEKDRLRIDGLRKRLDELRAPDTEDWTSDQLEAEIERLETREIGVDWQEVAAEATALRRDTVIFLTGRLERVREREARDREQAEAVKAAEEKAAAAEAAAEAARAEAERQREAAEKAEADKAAAVEAERQRLAQQTELEARYEADRAREAELTAEARRRLIEAIGGFLKEPPPIGSSAAALIADAIIAGRIPHVQFEPIEEIAA